MEQQTVLHASAYEQKLVEILRRLPPERVSELVDFAEFLELRVSESEQDGLLDENGREEEVASDDARWDALFASDESERLLEKMAAEALAELQAGRAGPIVLTEDGEIAPG